MEKILPSGAHFEGHALSYKESWSVCQTIINELKRMDIDVSKIDLELFKDVKLDDKIGSSHLALFMTLKDALCSLLGSQKIVESVDKCLAQFTYNKLKVTTKTFEKREARQDYLFAAFYALYENVSPFFEGLSSSLKTS